MDRLNEVWRRLRSEFRPALVEDTLRDVRHAARALGRAPAFTLACSLTLGSSIGAATAVFSVVHGVLIKPLPYHAPDALVSIRNHPRASTEPGDIPLSATQWFTYRDENRIFTDLGLWSSGTATITGLAEPEQVQTLRVTYGTLQALGVPPGMGRWFSQEDDTPGSAEAVMLADGYWKRRFGGDHSVTGRTLIVDSRPRTVIGVMPAGFRFLNQTPDLIVPLRLARRGLLLGAFNYSALGRLKPGVTLAEAGAELDRMTAIWLNAWPAPPGFDKQQFDRVPVLRPLKQDVVGEVGRILWVLMGTVGLVLLIACANVASLLLVRAEGRRHELAVRTALGAGWQRLARSLLVESVLLGMIGGIVGLGLTMVSLQLIVALGPAGLPRLADITVDTPVVSFALAVSLLSSVMFGLIPILKHAGPRVVPLFRAGERISSDGQRARHILVVVQVALALVLLVGSGLMIRTSWALRAVDPGFAHPDQVQLARITIPATLVDDPERVFRMQLDIRDRLAAVPGVTAASFASAAPLEPFVSANVIFSEDAIHGEGRTRRFKVVSPGFFATIGTPVVAGRDFQWSDLHQRRPVAVISENLARELWRNPASAIGKRIREAPEGPWREIVGVVKDVFDDGVHAPAPATAYWPAVMENFEGERTRVRRSITLAIRSPRAGTEGFLADVQRAVWAVNGSLPLTRVQTLQTIYEGSLARTSFTLVMLAIAGAMALLLGLIGIYAVIAFAVTQRTREIGIRVALGAQPRELTGLFVRRGVVLAAVGIICGVGASLALTRLMSFLLFETSPLDPATYSIVSLGLLAAAAIASYIPAHRAAASEPLRALRSQ